MNHLKYLEYIYIYTYIYIYLNIYIYIGPLHLIYCRRNGRWLLRLSTTQLFNRGISHHFLFNRCADYDMQCAAGRLSSVVPSCVSCVLDEFILVSPYGAPKKGQFNFCDSLYWWFCVCLFVDIFVSHMIVYADVQDDS